MTRKSITLLLPVLCVLFMSATRLGDPKIDVSAFVRQTQIMKNADKQVKLTWWIPTEYWQIVLEGNPDVTPTQIKNIVNALEDYVVVCVANLESEGLGEFKKVTEDEMRKGLSLIDQNGKEYQPLEEDDVDAGAMMIAGSVKPMFSKMLGDLGKSMHLFFFKVQHKGKNLIQADKEGKFTIIHSKTEFTWELPLPILMPAKKCPVDDAEMQGNWKFCPIHGDKLD